MPSEKLVGNVKPRSKIDSVLVVIAIAMVLVGLGRAVVGISPFPYVFAHALASNPGSLRDPEELLTKTWSEGNDLRPFRAWWGGRRMPWLSGDDWLGALSHRPLDRTLGAVLGAVALKESESGLRFTEVIMPPNERSAKLALIGTETTGSYRTAQGGVKVVKLRHPNRDFTWVTSVPVTFRDYDPRLSDDEVAELARKAKLVELTDQVFVAEPPSEVSGTWVLASRVLVGESDRREFYLIPLELSPVGGDE